MLFNFFVWLIDESNPNEILPNQIRFEYQMLKESVFKKCTIHACIRAYTHTQNQH